MAQGVGLLGFTCRRDFFRITIDGVPKILYVGICLAGLVTGLMVGLSSSPVVGAALPALVTALAGGVAIFFRNPLDAQISDVLKSWKEEDQSHKDGDPAKVAVKGVNDHKDVKHQAILDELRALEARRKAQPSHLGWVLTGFITVYFGGLVLGSEWRRHESISPRLPVPPGLTSALDSSHSIKEAWMRMYYYRNFALQGLKNETIEKILALPEGSPSPTIASSQQPVAAASATPVAQPAPTPLPPLPPPPPEITLIPEIESGRPTTM